MSASVLDYVHGGGEYMYRIYVPRARHLVFGIADGKVFAFTGYNIRSHKPDIVKDIIYVPDSLVERALNLALAWEQLQGEQSEIEKLLASI